MRPAGSAAGRDDRPSIYLLHAATPDVSSTMVRDRLRRGASIAGLVPPLVEAHIHQHRLYSAAADAAPEKSHSVGAAADHSADQLHGQK
jgi:hypothetical protein